MFTTTDETDSIFVTQCFCKPDIRLSGIRILRKIDVCIILYYFFMKITPCDCCKNILIPSITWNCWFNDIYVNLIFLVHKVMTVAKIGTRSFVRKSNFRKSHIRTSNFWKPNFGIITSIRSFFWNSQFSEKRSPN